MPIEYVNPDEPFIVIRAWHPTDPAPRWVYEVARASSEVQWGVSCGSWLEKPLPPGENLLRLVKRVGAEDAVRAIVASMPAGSWRPLAEYLAALLAP